MKPEKLVAAFRDLSPENAALACELWAARDDKNKLAELVDRVPQTAAYVRSLYSSPYDSSMWRRTVVLHAIDVLFDTCGVECIRKEGDVVAEYLNTGDTYATTLLLDTERDVLLLTSFGDFVESLNLGNEDG